MRRVVEKNLTRMEALSRAYSLSYIILGGDGESALRVVLESLNEWNVDWYQQKQRTYHRALPNRTPNKVILSRPALLQYIVCRQTTGYEIEQERAFLLGLGRLSERTLLLRFIKHLLHESASRSFYVAVGICRVLHKYDHATTKRFYAVLDQRDQERLVDGEPDNKTDDEYRRWKMILVDKLEHRFKEFVSVSRGPRNEKRFLANDQSGASSDYIRQCLRLLTPWETEHILPPEFVPTEFNITKLKCEGRRDAWDSAEENRMHTMIDPECFSRLTKACGAPAPEQQLEVPQFKSVEQGPGGGGGDRIEAPPEPTFAQAKPILDELDRRAMRRKVAVAEHLSVEVDGEECGRLDTTVGGGLRLDLHPGSRQIQVFTTDAEGKLLLASLWLSLIDITSEGGWESSVVLEGGQRLGIEIKPVLNPDGELESMTARISYQESNPLRILKHHFQQVRSVVSEKVRLDAAVSYAYSLQGVVHGYRSALPILLLLFAGITLSVILPRHKPHLTARRDARVGRTDNVGERQAGSTAADRKPSDPDTNVARIWEFGTESHGRQPAGAARTFSQGQSRAALLSLESEALASADFDSIELSRQSLRLLGADSLNLQHPEFQYTVTPSGVNAVRLVSGLGGSHGGLTVRFLGTDSQNLQHPEYYLLALSNMNAAEWVRGEEDSRGGLFFRTVDERLASAATPGDSVGWLNAPPLTRTSDELYTLFGSSPGGRIAICAGCGNQSFGGLPLANAEVGTVGIRTLGGGFNRVRKESGSVPADAFVGPLLPQYRVMHIGSHFAFTSQADRWRFVAAESFSPDVVPNAGTDILTLSACRTALGDDDQPLPRNRPSVGLASSGRPVKLSLSSRVPFMGQRAKAANPALEYVQAYSAHREQLYAETFNLFNDYGQRPLALRTQADAGRIWISSGDVLRAKKTNFAIFATNLVGQNQTTAGCGNTASGSNIPCARLSTRFEF